MNCQYVRDNLSAFIDREVDGLLVSSIEAHLQGCNSCRDYYEGLRNVSSALDAWEEVEPPVLLKRSVMEQVMPKRRVSLVSFILATAAALVIAASVFLIYGKDGARDAGINRNAPATIAQSRDGGHQGKAGCDNVNEDEIIANLQMFQEKDFYDSMDAMKKLDYLPLVDDRSAHRDNEKTSSLEFITS